MVKAKEIKVTVRGLIAMKFNLRQLILTGVGLVIILIAVVSLIHPSQLSYAGKTAPAPVSTPVPVFTPAPVELSSIHMSDANAGWAVTETSSLQNNIIYFEPTFFHTVNGGEQWADVTPAVKPGLENASYCFRDANSAWFALANGGKGTSIAVYRTENGGKAWKSSEIKTKQHGSIPTPKDICFADARNGWILVGYGVAMGSEWDEIYHTVDRGISWTLAATTGNGLPDMPGNLPLSGIKNGLCFTDDQNGFLAGYSHGDTLWFYETHDAGNTWTIKPLSVPPGYSARGGGAETQKPVFFNVKQGMLPVNFHQEGWPVIFYKTLDGGKTWHATTVVRSSTDNNLSWDILGMEHVLVTDGNKIYKADDGAQTWVTVAPDQTLKILLKDGESINALDFVTSKTGWAMISSTDKKSTQLARTTDYGRSWALISPSILASNGSTAPGRAQSTSYPSVKRLNIVSTGNEGDAGGVHS